MRPLQFYLQCDRQQSVFAEQDITDRMANMIDCPQSDKFEVGTTHVSKKISNDQELIQSDPTPCPQNQKGNN